MSHQIIRDILFTFDVYSDYINAFLSSYALGLTRGLNIEDLYQQLANPYTKLGLALWYVRFVDGGTLENYTWTPTRLRQAQLIYDDLSTASEASPILSAFYAVLNDVNDDDLDAALGI